MTRNESNLRLFGGILSLVVGIAVLLLKFYAYQLTESAAVFSDALESVVNVVAAAFALWAIRAAEAPPDQNHPYGHGKFEFVTAVFEGGLISFAALMIAYEAISELWAGATPPNLENGLGVMVLAGGLNGALGIVLIVIGKRTSSMALTADGKHVFTDFLTTVGILLGLGLVKVTNFAWLDPLIALAMAIVLALTGIPLVKKAMDGLMDAADPGLLQKILVALEDCRTPGLIRLHHMRVMRNGRNLHVDGHLVMPEFWTVEMAHDRAMIFEEAVLKHLGTNGEIEFHVDPCRRAYCSSCQVNPCPVRTQEFVSRPPIALEELLSPVDITDRPKP